MLRPAQTTGEEKRQEQGDEQESGQAYSLIEVPSEIGDESRRTSRVKTERKHCDRHVERIAEATDHHAGHPDEHTHYCAGQEENKPRPSTERQSLLNHRSRMNLGQTQRRFESA